MPKHHHDDDAAGVCRRCGGDSELGDRGPCLGSIVALSYATAGGRIDITREHGEHAMYSTRGHAEWLAREHGIELLVDGVPQHVQEGLF